MVSWSPSQITKWPNNKRSQGFLLAFHHDMALQTLKSCKSLSSRGQGFNFRPCTTQWWSLVCAIIPESSTMEKVVFLSLLLLCGDIESNPGPPRRSVQGKTPSTEQKIESLSNTLAEYEAKINGLENELDSQKKSYDEKLQSRSILQLITASITHTLRDLIVFVKVWKVS